MHQLTYLGASCRRPNHPHHVRHNIPYVALLRAARICSHIIDFNTECVRFDMSLLLNQYPPNFIKKQFHRCFHLNNALPVLSELNEEVYHRLHTQSLFQLTRREKQLHCMMQDPVKNPVVLRSTIWNSDVMYPRYIFDSGLTLHLKKKFTHGGKHIMHFQGDQSKMSSFKSLQIPIVLSKVSSYIRNHHQRY